MTSPEAPTTPEPEDPEAEPERQGTPFLLLQFFIFPMSIVAVCVAVFVIFGLIAAEGKGAKEYLDEVRTGSANRRWQAAFELSRALQVRKDPMLRDQRFVDELLRVFKEAANDDPRVRRYLALALGRLADPRAVPLLTEAARGTTPPDDETQIYAIWALGSIHDSASLPALVELARHQDAGVRKAAIHALGSFDAPAAQQALAAALTDATEDVQWNAALSLARRFRDPAAVPTLHKMLERPHLATLIPTQELQDAVMLEAVVAAGVLADAGLRTDLEGLRDADPSLKIREAARQALATPTITAR
jgi:hypothetical protein